jgi:anti-anti-sigma factor
VSAARSALDVGDVTLEHFGTKTAHDGDAIVVRLRGNADAQVHGGLVALLDRVDVEAKRLAVREAVIDVRDLYFMSSACLSLLVRWIATLAEHDRHRYKIRFVANANLRWQKRSLSALGAMGKGVVTIEEAEG